jgi:hypothetical protein
MDALLSVPVYDNVPQDAPHDFVVIGEGQELPDNTKTKNGVEHIFEINIYTGDANNRGLKQVKAISDQIYANLHRQTFTLTGYEATMPQFDSFIPFQEPDGARGVIRFRCSVQPSS